MKLMRLRLLSPLLVMLFQTAPAARAIVQGVQSRYQHAKTLQATFFEAYSEAGGRRTAESGTVYFSRPGRMRWEYESPEKKLFLVDGTNAWLYVPADRTVSRAKVRQSSDWRTPVALLAGKADLNQLCRGVQRVDPATAKSAEEKPLAPDDYLLDCDPRDAGPNSELRSIFLEVNPQAYLVRVVIRETGHVETEFRFGNWQENIPIAEAQFHFEPPSGVSVVEEGAFSDEVH